MYKNQHIYKTLGYALAAFICQLVFIPLANAQSITEAFLASCADAAGVVDNQGMPIDENSICNARGMIGSATIGAFGFNSSVSPVFNTSSAVLNTGINNALQNTISDRLHSNHRGNNTQRVSQFQLNGQALGGGASADANLEKSWGLFGNLAYTDGERDNRSINGVALGDLSDAASSVDQLGFDYSGYDFIVGADYRLNQDIVVGGTFSFSNQESEENSSRSDSDSDRFALSAFGSLYFDSGFYIDGVLGVGIGETEYSRELTYTIEIDSNDVNFSTLANADSDSENINASIGGGINLSLRQWSLNPFVQLNWQKTDLDSYRESATASAAFAEVEQVIIDSFLLEVFDQSIESLTSVVGIHKSRAFNLHKSVLVPQLSLTWVYQFEDEEDISSRFLFGDNRFTTETRELDNNYFTLGASVTTTVANNVVSFLQIETFLGHSDISQYSISAGVRKEL